MMYETPDLLAGYAGGPCDHEVDRESEDGCARQERHAPDVGDEARAMKSETVGTTALSAVAFARENVFAEIEVVKRGESHAPDDLANDIAKALDEQVKLALSR